jgi:hypothetical protein
MELLLVLQQQQHHLATDVPHTQLMICRGLVFILTCAGVQQDILLTHHTVRRGQHSLQPSGTFHTTQHLLLHQLRDLLSHSLWNRH